MANMSEASTPQWRTVTTIVIMSVVMIVALWICKDRAEFGVSMFGTASSALVTLAGFVAMKSLGQHLGYGNGVGGMFKTLFTNAKPGTDIETFTSPTTTVTTTPTTTTTTTQK